MSIPAKASGDIMEAVLIKGDLSKLSPQERAVYFTRVCESIGLNPLTRPLEYITLNGKLTLYAKRDCADQLRKINGISVHIVSQDVADGLLTVHVRAKDRDGREDEDLGVVSFPDTLRGDNRANAVLKAVTKAKRRVTLSLSGLGLLDETEVEDIPAAAKRPPKPAPNVMIAATGGGYGGGTIPSGQEVISATVTDPETGEVVEVSPQRHTPEADEAPATSQEPPQPQVAGAPITTWEEYELLWDGIMDQATDATALRATWQSDRQRQARDRLDPTEDELNALMDKVRARRQELNKGAKKS